MKMVNVGPKTIKLLSVERLLTANDFQNDQQYQALIANELIVHIGNGKYQITRKGRELRGKK